MFKPRYKVTTDNYAGWQALTLTLPWPFWYQLGGTNTHLTEQEAEMYIEWQIKKKEKRKAFVQKEYIPK